MALQTCPECGGKVSSSSPSCPHCGYGSQPAVVHVDSGNSSGMLAGIASFFYRS